MKSPTRKVLLLVAGAVTAALVFAVPRLANKVFARRVLAVSTAVSGEPCTLSGTTLSFRTETAVISDLAVGNLAGYSFPHVFKVPRIEFSFNRASLGSDTIHLHHLWIEDAWIFYEENEDQPNMAIFFQRLEDYLRRGPSEGRTLRIDELTIRNARCRTLFRNDAAPSAFDVPEITLRDLAGTGGEIMDQVSRQVARQVRRELGLDTDALGGSVQAVRSAMDDLGVGGRQFLEGLRQLLAVPAQDTAPPPPDDTKEIGESVNP